MSCLLITVFQLIQSPPPLEIHVYTSATVGRLPTNFVSLLWVEDGQPCPSCYIDCAYAAGYINRRAIEDGKAVVQFALTRWHKQVEPIRAFFVICS